MPIIKTKRGIERQAMKAIHHPPKATDTVKVSKEMQDEKRKMVRELIPFLMYLYKKHMGVQISEGVDLDMMKLINKAMRQMPGSPAQKKTIDQLNKMRKSAGMKPIGEDINIPISVGDTILGGKFKNKRIVVKSIDKNEKGDITINGKPLLKYRLLDESTLNEFGGVKFDLVGYDSNDKPVLKTIKRASDSFMKDVAKYGSEKLFKSGKGVGYVKIYYDKNHLATVKDGGRKIVKEKSWGKLPINEIPMGDLQKIDQFADKQLNPVDVVLTDKHFFDRLNDPRNGKEISNAELIGFFKRLAKHKKEFLEFLEKYKEVVATDDRTNINIPFMKQSNKAIAKTIMRKNDFKTSGEKLEF